MIKAGITGNDIHAVGELLRLLLCHPDAEIVFVDSDEHEHAMLTDIFRGMTGATGMSFTNGSPLDKVDVLFCCYRGDGFMRRFMRETAIPEKLKIIDLSHDFRHCNGDEGFVYGLPELNRRITCQAKYVSIPGDIASAVELALLPLAKSLLLNNEITATVIAASSCFRHDPGRQGIMSMVSPFDNDITNEVKITMSAAQKSFDADLFILPVMSPLKRGIVATVTTDINVKLDELKELYRRYYEEDSFIYLVEDTSLQCIIGTNNCFIRLDAQGSKLAITSCIDNMMKGCAGQAVHNMNLMFNLEETTGLRQSAIMM